MYDHKIHFNPFQLIVTKLRLDEIIIVWCHVCATNVSIRYSGNREHDQDGDSVIKVYWDGLLLGGYLTGGFLVLCDAHKRCCI